MLTDKKQRRQMEKHNNSSMSERQMNQQKAQWPKLEQLEQ